MKIGEVIHNSNSNWGKTQKTIAIAIDDKIDVLLQDYGDLYDPNYRKWHAKIMKQYGCETWERCARIARQDGSNPQRYFTWLLNRACK